MQLVASIIMQWSFVESLAILDVRAFILLLVKIRESGVILQKTS